MATPTVIEITYLDGTKDTVRPALVDGIAFEQHLRANPSLGELRHNAIRAAAYRAWHALHRRAQMDSGTHCPQWEDFMTTVADIELVTSSDDDEDTVDLAVDGNVQGKDTRGAALAN